MSDFFMSEYTIEDELKVRVYIKECPWCRYTPEFKINTCEETGGTWLWCVYCSRCVKMNIKSKTVSVRNTKKYSLRSWIEKIDELAHYWNEGNPMPLINMKVFDKHEMLKMISGYMGKKEKI